MTCSSQNAFTEKPFDLAVFFAFGAAGFGAAFFLAGFVSADVVAAGAGALSPDN